MGFSWKPSTETPTVGIEKEELLVLLDMENITGSNRVVHNSRMLYYNTFHFIDVRWING